MNLYERVGEKKKQKRTDEGQDAKIKELQKQIEDVKKREESNERSKWALDRRRIDIRDEDVRDSLARGGLAIGREYDRDYRRFGDRFAAGDGKPIHLRACVERYDDEPPQQSPKINSKAKSSPCNPPSSAS